MKMAKIPKNQKRKNTLSVVPTRMPQLDGLCALAILCVLWAHWGPEGYRSIYGTDLGFLGMNLFFVLSGFLITSILISAERKDMAGTEKWFILRQFYIRRILRIFPVYYLFLTVAVLVKSEGILDAWPWHAAYLSNWYFAATNSANFYGGHFWSLSVEEQFYLLWPALILFVPTKFRLACIIILIFCAPIFRQISSLSMESNEFLIWLTPAVLDSLGIGALLAFAKADDYIRMIAQTLLVFGIIGLILIGIVDAIGFLKQTFFACLFGWLIWKSSMGFSGAMGSVLQFGPIVYLGRISYGVYVIHGIAFPIWLWLLYSAPIPGYRIFARLSVPPQIYETPGFSMLMTGILTILLAALSFKYYENPINRSKARFPYLRPQYGLPRIS